MVSASHHRALLQEESTALAALYDKWQRILNDNDETVAPAIPDEVCGKIQIAIGQAQLLVKKKFEQFRGLIETNENGDSEMPVTIEDLQGFWELVTIQVVDIHKKFEELDKLKENNWTPSEDNVRQPLANLNKSHSNSVPRRKPLGVTKDFSAEAKERLAKAKALARKRMEEQCCV